MNNFNIVLERCDSIISQAKDVIKNNQARKVTYIITSMQNLLQLVYSGNVPNHLNYEYFIENIFSKISSQPEYISSYKKVDKLTVYLEAFKAFRDDLDTGIISSLSNIVTIDIFSNLIDQAIQLRENNTEPLDRAACVLTRIVLEDTLLKLCDNKNIILSNQKASIANDELKRNTIYGQAKWREIQSWLDIGNKAAHPDPEFDTITESDIDNMINKVKEFTENFLK